MGAVYKELLDQTKEIKRKFYVRCCVCGGAVPYYEIPAVDEKIYCLFHMPGGIPRRNTEKIPMNVSAEVKDLSNPLDKDGVIHWVNPDESMY